jgi:hypothetical protein
MKSAVYRWYRRGQCDDKQPSKEWIKAARAAISYVASIEFPKRCGNASNQLITCGLERGHDGDHNALGWAISDDKLPDPPPGKLEEEGS